MTPPVLFTTAAILLAASTPSLSAHATAPPPSQQHYSLVRKAKSASGMRSAIYRDGARETIQLSRANGWHSQTWFDFAAHKQYAVDSNAEGQCSVINYTSDGPPELLDPVPGAFDMAKQIPANAPRAGTAILASTKTRIIAMPGGGKIWIDDVRHLVMKLQVVMEGNPKPQTMFDLSGIRFDKSDPAALTPPSHCKAISGSANAHGGHAEVGAVVHSGDSRGH
ncbi:MAG: hypothetical protein WBW92_13835 [Rhodanobacteraceae bacterium]